jgi:hypothetical protein
VTLALITRFLEIDTENVKDPLFGVRGKAKHFREENLATP